MCSLSVVAVEAVTAMVRTNAAAVVAQVNTCSPPSICLRIKVLLLVVVVFR